MHALTMAPALVRHLFAVILLAGFLARSTGFERLHQCPARAAEHGTGHAGHEHGHRAPAGGDRCECVGPSCSTSIAAPPVRAALASPVLAFAAGAAPVNAVESRRAVAHLLPFAHGPPA